MLTGKIAEVIRNVKCRIVQLVVRRKRVKTNRSVCTSILAECQWLETMRFIRPVFNLLVIRTNQVVGKLTTAKVRVNSTAIERVLSAIIYPVFCGESECGNTFRLPLPAVLLLLLLLIT